MSLMCEVSHQCSLGLIGCDKVLCQHSPLGLVFHCWSWGSVWPSDSAGFGVRVKVPLAPHTPFYGYSYFCTLEGRGQHKVLVLENKIKHSDKRHSDGKFFWVLCSLCWARTNSVLFGTAHARQSNRIFCFL